MKTYLTAIALAASVAQPASAITFSSLTTIYVGTGIEDSGSVTDTGVATTFHCSNVSGVTATVRFQVLNRDGNLEGDASFDIDHGSTRTVSTHGTVRYFDDIELQTGFLDEGVVNIESTQSGVFCNAVTLDAATASPNGFSIPLVRVNPHPGTVE